MKFCDSEACPSCPHEGNIPDCLRRKANFCIALARTPSAQGAHVALERLSVLLLEEAAALEKETAALAPKQQSAATAPALSTVAA